MFIVGGSGKVPFQDRVVEFMRDNPGATVDECSRKIGIGMAAVYCVLAHLEDLGLVEEGTGNAEG